MYTGFALYFWGINYNGLELLLELLFLISGRLVLKAVVAAVLLPTGRILLDFSIERSFGRDRGGRTTHIFGLTPTVHT